MVSGRPTVLNLRLNSRPDSARLVRAVLGGVATPFALRPELVNDLKTVVSEACNNAVDHGYRGESGAIAVRVDIQLEEIEATVRDWGGGFQELAAAGDHLRVGLPLINALADRAQFLTAPGSGTEVRMGFDLRHDPRRTEMLVRLEDAEDHDAWMPWRRGLTGDVVVTLLPVDLLPSVLEPLTSALCARSRFSLERFSDVYIVARALTAHVRASASSSRVSFSITARDQRFELTIGPLKPGSGERLQAVGPSDRDAPVVELADELAFEALEHCELLRVVLIDHDRDLTSARGHE
ncbi:MAG TPA: ATP-binding protein [Solirubrobacteraceae bacterium]|nr:ATP-binding protein [Solirubrobacteraceae bacterium]